MEAAARNGGVEKHKNKTRKKRRIAGRHDNEEAPLKRRQKKIKKKRTFSNFQISHFRGFHLCPLPDANALAAIHKTHKTQDASLQCRPTHTHHHLPGNWFYRVGQRETSPPRLLGFLFPSPKVRERTWAGRSIIQRFIKKK